MTGARPAAAALAQQALARRAALLADPATTALRVFHRAADGLPGLAVDRYGPVLIAHLYDGLRAPTARPVLEALAQALNAEAVYLKHRPAQANTLSPAERAALAPPTPFLGAARAEVTALENGLRYLIRPGDGLSVGLFLDMRETRRRVREAAAGRTVLNCFAYTCAFGAAAAAGGAGRVVNVDVARRFLAWGEANYALNGFPHQTPDFISGDVFDWLGRLARRATRFDLVVLDPPSYATTKRSRFAAHRDYAALVAQAAAVVAPGGQLVACVNSAELPTAAFEKQVRAGLSGHPARLLATTHEPGADFPRPRGGQPYLKVSWVQFT